MHAFPPAGLQDRRRHLARVSWGVLAALLVVMPSITGGEEVPLSVGGVDLHLRFVAYATAAALLAVLAGAALLSSMRGAWLVAAGAWLAWLLLATVLAGQPAREWLPAILRWVLYLSVLVLARFVGDSLLGPTARRQFPLLVAAGILLPLAVGAVELLSGSARVLNNAPRISSTTFGHPVAFSLLLLVAGIVLLEVALAHRRVRSSVRVAAGIVVLAVLVELLFTYTRLTLALFLGSAIVLVVAMHPARRVAAGVVASVAAIVIAAIAAPLLVSRFEQPVVWPPASPPSASSPLTERPRPSPARPTPTPRLVLIDNSTKLRIQTHLRGVEYVVRSPIVGHGPGSFDRLFEADTGNDAVAAHNDILQFAVETGLPGLVIALLLYAVVTVPLLPALADGRRYPMTASAVVAFAAVNLGAVIHNPNWFPEVQVTIWAAVGLAVRPLFRVPTIRPRSG